MSDSNQDSRYYTHEFMSEFIDLYKSLPSLWKIKSKDYNNRIKKKLAYDVLVKKLRVVEPKADRNRVVKKINNIRSSYRREQKKIYKSKLSGASDDDIYTPSLWYYEKLDFLSDQEIPKRCEYLQESEVINTIFILNFLV